MTATLDIAYQNTAFNGENNENTLHPDKHIMKETIIQMPDGDTLQTQMSVEGARAHCCIITTYYSHIS